MNHNADNGRKEDVYLLTTSMAPTSTLISCLSTARAEMDTLKTLEMAMIIKMTISIYDFYLKSKQTHW